MVFDIHRADRDSNDLQSGRQADAHFPYRLRYPWRAKPDAVEKPTHFEGIAAPDMPLGSQGMAAPNASIYEVVTLDNQGRVAVYETVHGRSEWKPCFKTSITLEGRAND